MKMLALTICLPFHAGISVDAQTVTFCAGDGIVGDPDDGIALRILMPSLWLLMKRLLLMVWGGIVFSGTIELAHFPPAIMYIVVMGIGVRRSSADQNTAIMAALCWVPQLVTSLLYAPVHRWQLSGYHPVRCS